MYDFAGIAAERLLKVKSLKLSLRLSCTVPDGDDDTEPQFFKNVRSNGILPICGSTFNPHPPLRGLFLAKN